MIRRQFFLWMAGVCALAAGDKKMAVEDSLEIHRVAAPRLSPDGAWVVYTQTQWDRKANRQVTHLWLGSADGAKPAIQLTNGEKGETAPQWSPDGARLGFLADRTGSNQVWAIRPAGGEAEKLTDEETAVGEFQWSPDGKRLAYIVKDTPKDKAEREKKKKDKFDAIVVDADFGYTHLWTVDLATKAKKRLTEGAFSASAPRWSPDGKQIAYLYTTYGTQESAFFELGGDRNTDIHVVSAEGGAPRKLVTDPGTAATPVWSPDGTRIAYSNVPDAKRWGMKSEVMVIPAGGGAALNLTANFPDAAGGNLSWSPDSQSLYWDSQQGLRNHVFRVPAAGGRIEQLTEGARIYNDIDVAKDGKRIACVSDAGDAPAEIWTIAVAGGAPQKVSNANPKIADFAIAKSEAVRWKGPDGWDIEAWLTLPLGYTPGQKVPLILNIHGGPYGAHTARFDARSQIFAANGYAVLAPNPRGSTGYGQKFVHANVTDWGGKDFGDLMAGVDAMVAKGLADPNRLLVMGGSYGGFMTFWTITQTTRFKAAIGHAGISDWYSFYGQSDIPGLMAFGFGGQPPKAAETFRRWSPMTFVEKVKTPILITHGEQDRRVPITQAEQYYRSLRDAGVEAVFVRYPREGHGIQEPNHQVDLVGRQLEWFAKHLEK